MRSYRDLFATPEFSPLFLSAVGQAAGQTVAGLALGTLVYARTGSPLLAALGMFGPALAQAVGAAVLLSAADRLPPRTALAGTGLLFAIGTAVQAIPGVPIVVVFGVLAVLGLAGSLTGGVRFGLLNEILPSGGYLLGRSLLSVAGGVVQVCGFAVGGVLVAVLSARGALLCGAVLYLVSAAVSRFGLIGRAPRATGRPSASLTWQDNRRLWSSPERRRVYLALWVPNGLIVGCESLFVSYAPRHAGVLLSCAAGGMLAGDTTIGRFVRRDLARRLAFPLCVLLAGPYVFIVLHPPLPVAGAAVALASLGYAGSLPLQERLTLLVPDELTGHALGLYTSGMLAFQGIGATLAGTLAQRSSPAVAITLTAVASLAVTLILTVSDRAASPARAITNQPPDPDQPPDPGRAADPHRAPGSDRVADPAEMPSQAC